MTSNDDNQSRKNKSLVNLRASEGGDSRAPAENSRPDIEVSAQPVRADQALVQQEQRWMGEIQTSSDIKIHSSVWSWPEAGPGARVAAFVLDALILVGLLNLVDAAYLRLLDQNFPEILKYVVISLYYIVQHKRSGQTLGKRFVGIRVLPLEHSVSGVPLDRLLLRETVGRFLSVLFIGYGFWRIFFRKDRMGLHDSLSRTRVASLGQERGTVGLQLRYVVAGLVALVAAGGFSIYYMINYTAFPLREFAKKLEPMGFQIEGVEGNFSKGFSIEKIARETEDFNFELEGVEFRYEMGKGEETELSLPAITVRSARVIVHKWPAFGQKVSEAPVKKREDEGPFGADVGRKKGTGLPALLNIGSVDIADVEVQVPGRPAYHAKRVALADLKIKPSLKTLSLGQLFIDSDSVLINMKDIIAQEKTIAVTKPAYIEFKPSFYPELLKASVDVQFEGFFEDFKPTKLKLSAFANKLNLKYVADSGELNVIGLTPLHYFKTELPVWNVDFRLTGDFKTFNVSQMAGSMGVRNVRFQLESGLLTHVKGARRLYLSPRLQADWRNMLAGKDPGLILGSSDKLFAREALSDAYFSRPVAQLTQTEREMIDGDGRYFTDTHDAGALPPPPVAPVKMRAPTSVKIRKGVPPGVPTTLPAFKKRQRR